MGRAEIDYAEFLRRGQQGAAECNGSGLSTCPAKRVGQAAVLPRPVR